MAGMTHVGSYSRSCADPVTSTVAGTVSASIPIAVAVSTAVTITTTIAVSAAVATSRRMGRGYEGVWQQHGYRANQQSDERTGCDEPIGTFHWDNSLVVDPAEWSKSAGSLAIKGHWDQCASGIQPKSHASKQKSPTRYRRPQSVCEEFGLVLDGV